MTYRQGAFVLAITTMLWGSTFVIIKQSVAEIPPMLFNAWRFSLAVLPFVLSFPRKTQVGTQVQTESNAAQVGTQVQTESNAAQVGTQVQTESNAAQVGTQVQTESSVKRVWWAGADLAVWAWLAYWSQTVGLQTTSASRSAFITTLYVVMLPLAMSLLGKTAVGARLWSSVAMALLGVGLLTGGVTGVVVGDVWTLLTAVSYAVYIWRMDVYAKTMQPIPLTAVQMLVVAAMFWVGSALEGNVYSEALPWGVLLYLGLVASALCTILQVVGQKLVPPAQSALIYALEPVWATAFAVTLFAQPLGWKECVGGGLMVLAVLWSQDSFKR